MTYTSEVLADSPTIYWRLGDALASTTATDSSGNGTTGTVLTTLSSGAASTVTFGLPGLVGDSDTAVLFGSEVASGKGGIARAGVPATTQWFAEMLIQPKHATSWEAHFETKNAGVVTEARLVYSQARLTVFKVSPHDEITVAPSVSLGGAGKIHFVVGRDSTGHLHIWVDGVEIQDADLSGITMTHQTLATTLQLDADRCVIDEFAYYNHDVSEARFQAHLAAIPNTMTASLSLARWTATSDIEVTPILPESSSADININGAGAGYLVTPPTLTARILDPAQRRAPTALTVVASGAYPRGSLRFYYDTDVSYTYAIPADGSGNLAATSIPVPGDLTAGAHTLTVESQSVDSGNLLSVVLDFTLQNNPATGHVVGADADPVDIEDATLPDGERRWILQDLMPDGLGSYLFAHNPATTSRPDFERELKARRASANDGHVHVTEGVGIKYAWTIGGFCFTQDEQEALEAWGHLNRRFYIIDDFGEAWTVAATGVQITPRLRSDLAVVGQPRVLTDWLATFTLAVLVYDRDPITPVGAP